MAIINSLPKFYQVEANNLKGLQPGFVVAQMEVAASQTFCQEGKNVKGSSSTSASKKIANGHIVSISASGIVDAVAGSPLFIVYNEPLNTLVGGDCFYATDLDEECLRLVQLIPGDEWMSDMELVVSEGSPLAGRIVEITGEKGWYGVTTLADGTSAHHYMFLG